MDFVVPLLVSILLGAGVISLSARTLPQGERAWLVRTLTIALVLRLGAASLFALVPETRFFHEDAEGYEGWGMLIARGWHGHGHPVDLTVAFGQNYGYYYVCAAIYYFVPFAPAASMVNGVIGMATVFFVYRLAREFFHPIVARRAALLTAFFPSMILWSSIALKDPLMSLLIIIALLGCVQLKRRISIAAVLTTVLPIIAIQPIRFYMVYFVAFSVIVSLSFERGLRSVSGLYKQLVVAGAVVALLVVLGFAGRATQGTSMMTLEQVSSFRHGMATSAHSGFAEDVDISTPGGALAFLPLGIATLLLSPFPWQMTSIRALMAAPETIYWWILMPSMIRGVRFVIRERWREASPVLIFAATLTAGYSLVHGNVGSGFRQRAQIFVFLFIFVAAGLYQERCRRAKIDERELLTKA